ncbi:hypothetical protein SDC9_123725 [bioreactor metagenome]|uniref:Uncharacterized protein n=1 Tax=bioreactor metagenome TaxID=1076179 RepID=A0A645CIE0_9ZZZZ
MLHVGAHGEQAAAGQFRHRHAPGNHAPAAPHLQLAYSHGREPAQRHHGRIADQRHTMLVHENKNLGIRVHAILQRLADLCGKGILAKLL